MSGTYLRRNLLQYGFTIFCLIAFLCFSVVVSVSQEPTVTTSTASAELVPRVVYVELEGSQSGPLGVLPEMIYLQAAAHEALLRSASREGADSILRVEKEPGSTFLRVLLLNEEAVHEVQHRLRDQEPSFSEVLEIIGPTVEQLLPYLGPVERVRGEAELTLRRRQVAAAESLAFEDRLSTPWQLSLLFGELRQISYTEDTDSASVDTETISISALFPLIAELSHFRSRNFGLVGRMSLDYNSTTGFYDSVAGEGEDDANDRSVDAWDKTRNIIVLPGVGIMYRSLGRIAMDFTLLYSLGVAHVTATDAVTMDRDGAREDVLEEGESRVFLYQLLTLQPGVSYALNESWALRAGLSLSFDASVLWGGADATPYSFGAAFLLRWLQLGVARRF